MYAFGWKQFFKIKHDTNWNKIHEIDSNIQT